MRKTVHKGKMFVLNALARNLRFLNTSRSFIFNRNVLLYTSASLASKNYSPESSPVKTIVKKKRRISSSSEEEAPADKNQSTSLDSKK